MRKHERIIIISDGCRSPTRALLICMSAPLTNASFDAHYLTSPLRCAEVDMLPQPLSRALLAGHELRVKVVLQLQVA